jgi:hypothetical protein
MFSQYLGAIDGVVLYPVIALLLFFPIYVGIAVWAFRAKSGYINKMRSLPLIDDEFNKGDFNEID